MIPDPMRMQITLAYSPEAVFQALTTTDALMTWLAESASADLPQQVFQFWGRFTPETPSAETPAQTLLAVETNRLLKFTWTLRPNESTTVEIRLKAHEHGTLLTLLHETKTITIYQGRAYNFQDFWWLSLENLRRYLDGKPCNLRVDYTKPFDGAIRAEVEIEADAEQVFRVLVEPAMLERWIAHQASVNLEEGTMDYGWQGIPPIKLLEVDSPRKFVHHWADESIVTWTLEENGGKTRLSFVHSGFGPDKTSSDEQTGWHNFIGWIRSIAEYGDDWQPPVVDILPEYASHYSKTLNVMQAELLPLSET